MNNNNIILIGMPGAGKSTVGVVLAKVLGYDFVDTDLVIQKITGQRLEEIISTKGIDEFIKIEGEINCGIDGEKQIISPGGSIIYNDKAMNHFSSIGVIVYLNHSYDEIKLRLGDLKNRGVVLKENQTLHDLYLERTPYYEKYADINLKLPKGISIKATVKRLIKALKSNNIID